MNFEDFIKSFGPGEVGFVVVTALCGDDCLPVCSSNDLDFFKIFADCPVSDFFYHDKILDVFFDRCFIKDQIEILLAKIEEAEND